MQMARAVGSLFSCIYGYATTGEGATLIEALNVFGTILKDKFNGFADVHHQFVLRSTLRNGLWKLLALAAIQACYRVMFYNNRVFCHNVMVFRIGAKIQIISDMAK